ncbi:hypothetical protein FRUB_00566 [Fimbriiglobus ruber]|uniref:Uncharacterized protein n=1 Tax=Fimbriiglobus ruber TaxID=1908690 RepID=A0A225EF44_9BACT|nr:hypothetical protein FRUB_00566 [Fimbriiglobus ruber]
MRRAVADVPRDGQIISRISLRTQEGSQVLLGDSDSVNGGECNR